MDSSGPDSTLGWRRAGDTARPGFLSFHAPMDPKIIEPILQVRHDPVEDLMFLVARLEPDEKLRDDRVESHCREDRCVGRLPAVQLVKGRSAELAEQVLGGDLDATTAFTGDPGGPTV